MIILVSGASKTVAKFAGHPNLGQLITPHDGNKIRGDMPWAADNAAYSNWCPKAFLRMLNRIDGMDPLWCAAPDTVGDAMSTLRKFKITAPMIKKRNLKCALVLQDGQEWIGVRWHNVDAVFLGGTTEYKLSAHAKWCMFRAKDRGLAVHVGRVNSIGRLRKFREYGCVDTVDGTGYSRWSKEKLIPALRYLETEQLTLGY